MKEFKGSQGRFLWREAHDEKYNQETFVIDEEFGGHILTKELATIWEGLDYEQSRANAKLFAVSKILLEMLQESVVGYEWQKENRPELWDKADDEHLDKCYAAISKALD